MKTISKQLQDLIDSARASIGTLDRIADELQREVDDETVGECDLDRAKLLDAATFDALQPFKVRA